MMFGLLFTAFLSVPAQQTPVSDSTAAALIARMYDAYGWETKDADFKKGVELFAAPEAVLSGAEWPSLVKLLQKRWPPSSR
jgi:hypothetical protein